MRIQLLAVAAILVGLILADTAAAEHLDKAVGNWKLASAEREGKSLPKEDLNNVTVTVSKGEGDTYKIVTKQGEKIVAEGTAKTHKTADKHDQYDITYTKGETEGKSLAGKTLHGIITVEGDTMKVCWHGSESYPKEHSAGKDSDCTLRTYQRVKK